MLNKINYNLHVIIQVALGRKSYISMQHLCFKWPLHKIDPSIFVCTCEIKREIYLKSLKKCPLRKMLYID